MPVMAVAALIVAIFAFVAAAFNDWYARDVARTERDRRLEERAPKIIPGLRQVPDHEPPWVLELLLDHETASGPLAEVSATITRFTQMQGDTYPAGDMDLGGYDGLSHSEWHGQSARWRGSCPTGRPRWRPVPPGLAAQARPRGPGRRHRPGRPASAP